MSFLDTVANSAGNWQGTNSFRLMPDHDWFSAPSSATVASAARGSVVTVQYDWVHPDDGAQEGALVIANAGSGQVKGLWLDTWHQSEAQVLDAVSATDCEVAFEYSYGGEWRWQIVVVAGEALTVTMRNIVPADAESGREATEYEAMEMQLLA